MISHEDWMKGTSVFGYPRSPEMKALDEAIRKFKAQSVSSRKSIETALEDWKAKERNSGKQWQKSRRNQNGTIEKLDLELRHVIRARTPEELEAMWEVRKGNEQNLKTLFSGKQLVVKNSKAASGAEAIASAASGVEGSIKSGMKAAKAAASGASPTEIVTQLCGGSTSALGNSGFAVLSAFSKAMPLLNVISGGISVSSKLVSIAKSGWMKYRTAEQARSSFAPGDPAAALDAVHGWLVDTEVMKKKADPLIDKAGELIRNRRYEIPELSHFKGVGPPSINKWSNLFLAKASRFKYELETSKDEGAKFKPQGPGQLPVDFKSRITGEGPKPGVA